VYNLADNDLAWFNKVSIKLNQFGIPIWWFMSNLVINSGCRLESKELSPIPKQAHLRRGSPTIWAKIVNFITLSSETCVAGNTWYKMCYEKNLKSPISEAKLQKFRK
jgi:hypothetical protein